MKYVMIFYIYDANYVEGIPIKNRTENEFLRTYKETYAKLTNKGYRPKFHKIDNECLKAIEAFIDTKNTKLQFAPPVIHQQNAAERAVRTWKNQFILELPVYLRNYQSQTGVG